MGLLCILFRMYTVLFKVNSFRSPCFKEYMILTHSWLCFLWIGREGPAEMPKVWFLISSLQEARQHSNQVLDQRIPINCLLPTLRPDETLHLVLRGQLWQLGFQAKACNRSIAGHSGFYSSPLSIAGHQNPPVSTASSSSGMLRFFWPVPFQCAKEGWLSWSSTALEFLDHEEFLPVAGGLGWWVSSFQVKISQKMSRWIVWMAYVVYGPGMSRQTASSSATV